jgi:hypothetical protein
MWWFDRPVHAARPNFKLPAWQKVSAGSKLVVGLACNCWPAVRLLLTAVLLVDNQQTCGSGVHKRLGDACLLPAAAAAAGAESATQADELPLPLEYLAAHRELLLAYKLLEADSSLKARLCGSIAAYCTLLHMIFYGPYMVTVFFPREAHSVHCCSAHHWQ